ncbi:hypothetical protein LTR36_004464 [Oleoguttula mirabilis]|uniref:Uncharacterized protein n=1 Tax=Oleoguttula mirabilis TaxID=1507867 RepID=A0AAV9JGD3_9PEZI|nr:hypothetical protein LTR36_004464 [Oleoguttula mirabilis]
MPGDKQRSRDRTIEQDETDDSEDHCTPSRQLIGELAATLSTSSCSLATGSADLLDRVMTLPDEIKELIIGPRVTVGIVDTMMLYRARYALMRPDLKLAVLQPFEKHKRLHQIATEQFYKANVFHASVTFYELASGNSYPVLGDDWESRDRIRHLDFAMEIPMTQASIDPHKAADIGREHRKALTQLPAEYPQLRTLRIILKHDPKHCGLKVPYPGQKHEITAWESRCLLTSIISGLQACTSPHLRSKEVRLDQTTYWERVAGVVREPVAVDGRNRGIDEIVWKVLGLPLSVTSI